MKKFNWVALSAYLFTASNGWAASSNHIEDSPSSMGRVSNSRRLIASGAVAAGGAESLSNSMTNVTVEDVGDASVSTSINTAPGIDTGESSESYPITRYRARAPESERTITSTNIQFTGNLVIENGIARPATVSDFVGSIEGPLSHIYNSRMPVERGALGPSSFSSFIGIMEGGSITNCTVSFPRVSDGVRALYSEDEARVGSSGRGEAYIGGLFGEFVGDYDNVGGGNWHYDIFICIIFNCRKNSC